MAGARAGAIGTGIEPWMEGLGPPKKKIGLKTSGN